MSTVTSRPFCHHDTVISTTALHPKWLFYSGTGLCSALLWPRKNDTPLLIKVLSFLGQPVNVSAVGLWHMDQHGWAQSGHQSADKDPRGRGWFSLPGGEFLSCLMLWIFQSAASNSSVSGVVVLPPPHSSFTLLRGRYGNRLSVAITSCFWRQALCSLHSTGFNIVQ